MVLVILGHIFWVLFGCSLAEFRLYISSLAAANKLTGSGIKYWSSVAAGSSLGTSLQSLHLLLIDFLIPHSSCCKPFPLSSIPLIFSPLSTHRAAGDHASMISSLSHCLWVLCHLYLNCLGFSSLGTPKLSGPGSFIYSLLASTSPFLSTREQAQIFLNL